MVELIWEPFGVVRRLSGVVESEELDASAKKIQGHERTDDLYYIIHDFTGCSDVLVSANDIRFMAVRATVALQRNERVKIAFVGTHPVVHALIDAFNSHARTKLRCNRFDTLEEARRYTVVPSQT